MINLMININRSYPFNHLILALSLIKKNKVKSNLWHTFILEAQMFLLILRNHLNLNLNQMKNQTHYHFIVHLQIKLYNSTDLEIKIIIRLINILIGFSKEIK